MRTVFQRFWAVSASVMLSAAPLFAEGAKPQQKGNLFGDPMIMMMLFIVLIVWFLMIRPEQRKQKERQKMLQNLKKGDKVMTSAGIVGIVGTIKDNTVMIKISDNNTVVEFSKSAVTAVMAGESSGSAKT
ncbi:MAG: preprotein translocase subunit YajC [Chitinispirillaceae bacterium]|nr:preprotein translocase subunit YajC [Chitinispirillaceae bacterium]